MKMRTRSGAEITINIEPEGTGSHIAVRFEWHTTRPLGMDDVIAFLQDLDKLGLDYIVTRTEGLPEDATRR